MLTALLCLQIQAGSLTKQPTTIDVVGYESVQSALPSGEPDLRAPDNYYVCVKSHYVLVADSDRMKPDDHGDRVVHLTDVVLDSREGYAETAKAKGKFAELFTQVKPPLNRADYALHTVSTMSYGSSEQTIYPGNHYLVFRRETSVEKIETHTLGKRRITRTATVQDWGSNTTILHPGQILDPSKEQVYWCESKPEVRVALPVYGYDPIR